MAQTRTIITRAGLGKRLAHAATSLEDFIEYSWYQEARDFAEQLARDVDTKKHMFRTLVSIYNAMADDALGAEAYVRTEFPKHFLPKRANACMR